MIQAEFSSESNQEPFSAEWFIKRFEVSKDNKDKNYENFFLQYS